MHFIPFVLDGFGIKTSLDTELTNRCRVVHDIVSIDDSGLPLFTGVLEIPVEHCSGMAEGERTIDSGVTSRSVVHNAGLGSDHGRKHQRWMADLEDGLHGKQEAIWQTRRIGVF